MMTIGQVAVAVGLSTSAIRYYEREGLLKKPIRRSGRRVYGADVLDRLRLIRFARDMGFSVREVRTLVVAADGQAAASKQLQVIAQAKLVEIEEALRRAKVMKQLMQAAARCDCPSISRCVALAQRLG